MEGQILLLELKSKLCVRMCACVSVNTVFDMKAINLLHEKTKILDKYNFLE